MNRMLLFALIGGGLVVLLWLIGQSLWRRQRGRRVEHRAAERERLARDEPGGRPADPIEVESPAVVEPRAARDACPRCGAPVRVTDHQARSVDGQRLRVAVVECSRCGLERELYFRLIQQQPH